MATAFGVRALGRQSYAHRRDKPFNSHTVSISSPSKPGGYGWSIHRDGKMNSWIVHRKPNPEAKLRLFCFPYAGGGASIYKTWADHLPSEVDVCPIQPPGREGRRGEAPYNSMPPLIEAVTEAILPLLDRPFALFGHCMGAKVAFELARYLRQHYHLNPSHLFVSACPAPQLEIEGTTHDLPEKTLIDLLRMLSGSL